MLIVASPADSHAKAVAWALEEMGEPVHFLSASDIPARVHLSHRPAERAFGWSGAPAEPQRVVWLRRIGRFALDPGMEAAEHDFARDECRQLFQSLLLLLERDAVMANAYSATVSSAHKPYQLAMAERIGFRIPPTLVSSDPAAVADFYARAKGRIIYKAMTLPHFGTDEAPLILPTTRLEPRHVADAALIAACPGVYQREIDRTAELRVLVMGADVVAMRYRPRGEFAGPDWRQAQSDGICEPFALPAPVEALCRALVAALGLRYGCIDLAQDKAGAFIFFEINSAGQFLFMEESVPSLGVLRRFAAFLVGLGGAVPARRSLSLADYDARAA